MPPPVIALVRLRSEELARVACDIVFVESGFHRAYYLSRGQNYEKVYDLAHLADISMTRLLFEQNSSLAKRNRPFFGIHDNMILFGSPAIFRGRLSEDSTQPIHEEGQI